MKEYKLNLTAQQAEALRELIKTDLELKENNIAKKLIKSVMKRFYKRLRNHVEDRPNKSFNMSMTEDIEIAFYSYFKMYLFETTQIYERGFISKIMIEIDKRIC